MSCANSIAAAEIGMSKKERKKHWFSHGPNLQLSALPFEAETFFLLPHALSIICCGSLVQQHWEDTFIYHFFIFFSLHPPLTPQPLQKLRLCETRDFNDRAVTLRLRRAPASFCGKISMGFSLWCKVVQLLIYIYICSSFPIGVVVSYQ